MTKRFCAILLLTPVFGLAQETARVDVALTPIAFEQLTSTDLGYARSRLASDPASNVHTTTLRLGGRTLRLELVAGATPSLRHGVADDGEPELARLVTKNARLAIFEVPLEPPLLLEVRWFPGRDFVLYRSRSLLAGTVQVGEDELPLAVCHTIIGSDFADAQRLTLWLDRDRDGRFEDGESLSAELPFRVGAAALQLDSVTADGSTACLRPYTRPHAFSLDFLFPPADATDLAGDVRRIGDAAGELRVVNIWARHCAPCIAEMGQLDDLAKRFERDDGVRFQALSPGKPAAIRDFLANREFRYEQFTLPAEHELFARGFPWHLILDRAGRIRWMAFGAAQNRDREIARQIELLREPSAKRR